DYMSSGIYDSIIFGDGYSTAEMRAVFDDEQLIQNWLDIEAELARCQGELGLIPKAAAEEISAAVNRRQFDFTAMKKSKSENGHNIVSMVKILQTQCSGMAGEYIHYGATTQDIMDTGLSMAIKSGLEIIGRDSKKLYNILVNKAERYRNTVMAGRTHGQHAVPITFGYKTAVWAEEMYRHIERIRHAFAVGPVLEFSGAAGTLATIDSDFGFELQDKMAEALKLQKPVITWHTARDGFTEVVCTVAMIAATGGKIANEVLNLQKTEVGELEEPWKHGEIGSSTMPHKRNPSKTENVYLLSKLVKTQVPMLLDAMIMEHEREWFSRGCEMKILAEVFMLTAAILRDMITVMDGLVVNEDRMRTNLDLTHGLIMSERVMMVLGEKVGKQTAHEIVYEACQVAFAENRSLSELLKNDDKVRNNLTADEIDKILDPTSYLGLAPQYVDRVVNRRKQLVPGD
ncbi:MAG TPA: adenylosuccinate lyase, partial [Clostridia bacterium]|nr:adenylosuccinate lyase [Clostridia bacterium]